MKKVVVALGGNALQAAGKPATAESQLEVVKETASHIADMIQDGYEVIIAHGNGPQVGRIVIQNETADSVTPAMPFDVCGAKSQGMIGYHVQQALGDELRSRGIKTPVTTLVTQVVVDGEDPGFKNPTKPIGPFYTKEESDKLETEKGYNMVEDSGRGYRRVVASPMPKRIVELEAVKALIDAEQVVITVGGGGIPVVETEEGKLKGVAAVIDKDLAAERLAEDVDADMLVILTAVDKVSINFGKENQEDLAQMTIADANRYIEEGHFAPGSMLPKVKAAMMFAESKEGRKSIIASLGRAKEALKGESGTTITM